MIPLRGDDLDPALAGALQHAFVRPVDVDTAARHLWAIDREARRLSAASSRVPVHARRGTWRTAVAALASTLLVGSSGVAVAASNSALPGDVLYPVKRGAERARLLVAVTPEAEALVMVDIARERVSEAETAVRSRPEVVATLIEDAAGALQAAGQVDSPEVAAAVDAARIETSQTVASLEDELHDLAHETGQDVADAREQLTTEGPAAEIAPDPTVTPPTGEPAQGSPQGSPQASVQEPPLPHVPLSVVPAVPAPDGGVMDGSSLSPPVGASPGASSEAAPGTSPGASAEASPGVSPEASASPPDTGVAESTTAGQTGTAVPGDAPTSPSASLTPAATPTPAPTATTPGGVNAPDPRPGGPSAGSDDVQVGGGKVTAAQPAAEAPAADAPAADAPAADDPIADDPTADDIVAEAPAADDTVVEAPAADDAVTDDTVTDDTVVDDGVVVSGNLPVLETTTARAT